METIKITSIQSPNADFFPRTVAEYLSERLGLPIDFVGDPPWPHRERMLDAGEVQAGWICGLPYVRKVARPQPQIELLAAPVMRPPRYQNHPVYFSDVTVHRDSPFRIFPRPARGFLGIQRAQFPLGLQPDLLPTCQNGGKR